MPETTETAALAEARVFLKKERNGLLQLLKRDFFFQPGGYPEWVKTVATSKLFKGTEKWTKRQGKHWWAFYLF
jgi:hypothetical protein